MNKYIGQWRIVCEFDQVNLKPNKESTYIYCNGEGSIWRRSNNVLVYTREKKGISNILIENLNKLGVEVIADESTREDIQLVFNEKDLDVVARYFKARESGVNINPWSRKNLNLFKWFKNNKQSYIDNGYYKISEELTDEEKEIFRQRFNK
jgi:hypothetical protein